MGDQIELTVNIPIGRPGQNPAFAARLWVDLDLNGSMRVGDGPGELPGTGMTYPAPLIFNAAEPAPGNGAGLSGYTTLLTPVAITLATPRGAGSGPVSFEVQLDAADNSGLFVTDASGRQAPPRTMGALPLQ
jgi:hypothetical protein